MLTTDRPDVELEPGQGSTWIEIGWSDLNTTTYVAVGERTDKPVMEDCWRIAMDAAPNK